MAQVPPPQPYVIDILGGDEAMAALKVKFDEIKSRVATKLYTAGELSMTDSKRRAPVDTGTLRSSGHVEKPSVGVGKILVLLGYGGAASAYAHYQHGQGFPPKLTTWQSGYTKPFSKLGGEGYLYNPVKEAVPEIVEEVKAAIEEASL